MPMPLASPIALAGDAQARLESIVRAHSTSQALALRCQVILRAAASDRPSNLQVASELHCNRHTVGRWRSRYLAHGLSGLHDAPRPGRPRRFSPSTRLDVMAMATRKPSQHHCAATRWSLDDLVAAPAQGRTGTMEPGKPEKRKHEYIFTPKHGSWLNQVAWWLSVFARRFLKRGDFASAHGFETRLSDYT